MSTSSSTTFLHLPGVIQSHLMTSYLSITDLRSLRLVSSSFRVIVDMECVFRVTLTNASSQWVKSCVPYIQEAIIGPLKSSDFLEWPDSLFPEVEEVTCTSLVEESNVLKVFRVFPNVREICLRNMSGKEMTSFLELKLDQQSLTLSRNKVLHSSQIVTPAWSLITKLKIVMNKMSDSHGEVFRMLSKRPYPHLTSLHLEYRLQGYYNGLTYDQLHVVYIFWLQFIGLNCQYLKDLTLMNDFGVDLDPQFVPENPQDNLELTLQDSIEFGSLTEQWESIKLKEMSLKLHYHEEISNKAWNWNLKLLKCQDKIVHLKFDCSDCWKSSDPEILRNILIKLKETLKSLEYTSKSFRGPLGEVVEVIFDLSMLEECTMLEKLTIERGWSRRLVEWGPPITFRNVERLPVQSLKTLSLRTDNGKFKTSHAMWISNHLVGLEDVHLSTCMTKALVTNFLRLPRLKRFTLIRDYFSEIKVRKMVIFCDNTPGLSYFCPDIHAYDPEGRWLDLLTITVMVNRSVFTLVTDELFKKFPDVLEGSNCTSDEGLN